MNQSVDVIVAGAGPAGSVAAASLASRGVRVLLCDRSAFPRDKVCGDALIADSLAVLARLGLEERVMARSRTSSTLDIATPRGINASIPGMLRVLPRRELDAILLEHAVACGAEFRQLSIDAPLVEGDQVTGVAGRDASGRAIEIRAPLTVLATGANGAVLRAFDPHARTEASGTALRVYARPSSSRDAADATGTACVIAIDRSLRPGYAWAFPAPGGMMNVGVGLFRGADLRSAGVNLRGSLEALLAGSGPIGRRFGPFTEATAITGAPLRTSLEGTTAARRGLVVIGEAAGTTYAATGEGIGKAMESGLLVAELADNHADLPSLGLVYSTTLRARFGPRFRAYATAQRWVSFPWFVDYVAKRATQSPYITRRLSEFLSETDLPIRVFSLRGLWRLTTAR